MHNCMQPKASELVEEVQTLRIGQATCFDGFLEKNVTSGNPNYEHNRWMLMRLKRRFGTHVQSKLRSREDVFDCESARLRLSDSAALEQGESMPALLPVNVCTSRGNRPE